MKSFTNVGKVKIDRLFTRFYPLSLKRVPLSCPGFENGCWMTKQCYFTWNKSLYNHGPGTSQWFWTLNFLNLALQETAGNYVNNKIFDKYSHFKTELRKSVLISERRSEQCEVSADAQNLVWELQNQVHLYGQSIYRIEVKYIFWVIVHPKLSLRIFFLLLQASSWHLQTWTLTCKVANREAKLSHYADDMTVFCRDKNWTRLENCRSFPHYSKSAQNLKPCG